MLADSPVGYWRFEEISGTIMQDETTNNNDLTAQGSPTLGVVGAVDKGASAPGTTQYFTIATAATYTISEIFTIEAWIKRNTTTSAMGVFIHNVVNQESRARVGVNPSGYVELNNKDGVARCVSSIPINDTNWHHVIISKAGSTASNKIYVDGLDKTGTTTTTGFSTTATYGTWLRGTSTGNVTITGNGSIDECAIYSTALSDARIQAHYNATLSTLILVGMVGI
ncbi:MAG: LamG domain-containing protein [Rubrobacteraceae bacterium]